MGEDTNVFRKEWRELSDTEKTHVANVKGKAAELYDLLVVEAGSRTDPRAMAVARTKLEEAVMWATKAITA